MRGLARALILICIALLQGQPSARADAEPSATQPAAEPSETLRRAVEAYEAGDLATARALFEEVHAQAPSARTLRSLGLVAFRQERFADAVQLLEDSLASPVKPLPDALRATARELLDEARQKLRAEPPDPSDPVAPQPAAAATTVELPAQPLEVPPPPAQPSARSRRFKRAGYSLLGAGGALLITGGALGLTALGRLHDIEQQCEGKEPDGKCFEDEARRLERDAKLDLLSALALGGAVLGGLALGAGGTLLFLHYRPARGERGPARVVSLTLRANF